MIMARASATRDCETVKDAIRATEALNGETRMLLLQLLASMEGEIQARDVTLGVLKSECLKSLLAFVGKQQSYLSDPSYALERDALLSKAIKVKQGLDVNYLRLHNNLDKHKLALRQSLYFLKESEKQRETCLQELKVLKEAKLEESNRFKELEEKCLTGNTDGKHDLSLEAESLQSQLKEEKNQKLQLVTLLLHDRKQVATRYLEEKRRNDVLSRLVKEENGKTQTLAIELEEESKRSLALEADVEHYIRQMAELEERSKKSLLEEKRKSHELEEALRRSSKEADHLRKQLAEAHRVAMSQASNNTMPSQPSFVRSPNNLDGFALPQTDAGVFAKGPPPAGKLQMVNEDNIDLENSDHLYLRQSRPSHVKAESSGKKNLKAMIPPPIPPNKPRIMRNPPGAYSVQSQHQHVAEVERKMRFITE